MKGRVQLNVSVSEEAKAALVADANARGESLNDRACSILGARYRVPVEGTGRPSSGARTSKGPLPLWLPPALYRKIHAAAVGTSKKAVVEADFRAHYGLDQLAAA